MRLVVRKKNFIFRMYVVVGGLLFWEAFFTPPRGGEGVSGGPGEHFLPHLRRKDAKRCKK